MQPGTCLGDRYVVDERVGGGEHGSVWLGRDTVLDRPVRIKVLDPELTRDEEARARFRRTTLAVASLDVPGVAEVFDCVEEPDGDDVAVWQIGERVEGEPLRRMLTARTLDAEDTLELVARTARTLNAVHDQGLRHANLKPTNVIVAPDGSVRIVDFGFGPRGDVASDVRALGALAYECLTGAPPPADDTDAPLTGQRTLSLPGDVAPAVAAFLRRALSAPGSERFDTAAALALECERVAHSGEVRGTAVDPDSRAADTGSAAGLGSLLEAALAPDVEPATPMPVLADGSEPVTAPASTGSDTDEPDASPPVTAGPEATAATPIAAEADAAAAASRPEPVPDTASASRPEPELVPAASRPDSVPDTAAASRSESASAPVPPRAAAEPRSSRAASPPPATGQRPRRKRLVLVAVLLLVVAFAGTAVLVTWPNGETPSSAGDGRDVGGITEPGDTDTTSPGPSNSDSHSAPEHDPAESESDSPSESDSSTPDSDDEPDDSDDPQTVRVPNVVGDTLHSANNELRDAGLKVDLVKSGNGDHACRVHDQKPNGGTVETGSTVDVHVRFVNNPNACNGNDGDGDGDD